MSILLECKVGQGKRALIVDDEPTVGHVMSRVLEHMGYEVDCVLDGQQAMHMAKEAHYSTVICDILMPGLNGMALYETWQEECPELVERTIFVTGDCLGFEVNEFLARTGARCIFKPFKLDDLARLVAELQTTPERSGAVAAPNQHLAT